MSSEKATSGVQIQVKGLEARLAFEQSMRDLINRLHSSSLDDILLYLHDEIAKLVTCERITIYAYNRAESMIFSKVKDGDEISEIRVPVSAASISGYVALVAKPLRIKDAYNTAELAGIDPHIRHDASWDKKTGFRTREVVAAPIIANGHLYGVIQAVNTRHGKPFTESEEYVLQELSKTLGIAFHNQARLSIRASRHDYLLRSEQITGTILDQAQALAKKNGVSIDHVLITEFGVPRDEIIRSLCEYFKCEYIPFSDNVPIPAEALEKFTLDYLKYNTAVPLGVNEGKMVVVLENPKNVLFLDTLQQVCGRGVTPKVSMREEIFEFIDYFYGIKRSESGPSGEAAGVQDLGREALPAEEDRPRPTETVGGFSKAQPGAEESSEDDSGVIRLVNQIIEQAYKRGASDIHIEPYPDADTAVRVRVDGICHDYTQVPKKFSRALVARIKIMSDLDISDRRLPQDGKIRFKNYGTHDIELRVATLPTAGGQEDVVLRLLPSSKPLSLDQIDMIPETLTRFKKAIGEPCGIVLCVGPTGSGKTTTLHAVLGHLNQPDTKIWTAEDPVEVTQKGLRQIQVHPKIGLTFARCLRSFLRADPDVIMIGEMRDIETAEAAIEASLTGHMVFSTLHTNSAPETVARLLALGADPFLLVDSIVGVLAQRLIRRVCKGCRETYSPSHGEWEVLSEEYGVEAFAALKLSRADAQLARGKGCKHCNHTGYRGRLGLHEFLTVDNEIRPLIYHKAPSSQVRDFAIRGGMILLKQDGIRKVLVGLTDFKEVRSACMK